MGGQLMETSLLAKIMAGIIFFGFNILIWTFISYNFTRHIRGLREDRDVTPTLEVPPFPKWVWFGMLLICFVVLGGYALGI